MNFMFVCVDKATWTIFDYLIFSKIVKKAKAPYILVFRSSIKIMLTSISRKFEIKNMVKYSKR